MSTFTIAALLAIAVNFNTGLEALEAQDYAAAQAAFAAICDQTDRVEPAIVPARLLLAEAHAGAGDQAQARAELLTLWAEIRECPRYTPVHVSDWQSLIHARYTAYGGDLAVFTSAKDAFEYLRQACLEQDDALIQMLCIDAETALTFRNVAQHYEFYVLGDLERSQMPRGTISPDGPTIPGGTGTYAFAHGQMKAEFKTVDHRLYCTGLRRENLTPASKQQELLLSNLRVLHGLTTAWRHEEKTAGTVLAPDSPAIKALLTNTRWTSLADGSAQPFITPSLDDPQLGDPARVLVRAPESVEGRQAIGYADGHSAFVIDESLAIKDSAYFPDLRGPMIMDGPYVGRRDREAAEQAITAMGPRLRAFHTGLLAADAGKPDAADTALATVYRDRAPTNTLAQLARLTVALSYQAAEDERQAAIHAGALFQEKIEARVRATVWTILNAIEYDPRLAQPPDQLVSKLCDAYKAGDSETLRQSWVAWRRDEAQELMAAHDEQVLKLERRITPDILSSSNDVTAIAYGRNGRQTLNFHLVRIDHIWYVCGLSELGYRDRRMTSVRFMIVWGQYIVDTRHDMGTAEFGHRDVSDYGLPPHLVLLYPMAEPAGADLFQHVVAAEPEAHDGRRFVLMAHGHVLEIDEAAFQTAIAGREPIDFGPGPGPPR